MDQFNFVASSLSTTIAAEANYVTRWKS